MSYRLTYINKYNDKKILYFDSYEDLECNFAHCYYSKNIVKAVGEEIDFLNSKILLKF